MKILIIIPAFNEEKSIIEVVKSIKKQLPEADVLVIDDCSTDKTKEVLKNNKVKHIPLPINLGIGGAMQTGYMYAHKMGYDFAIQVDGDGQHDPAEIKKLFEKQQKEKVDLVIGSRFIGEGEYDQTFFRRLGILIFSQVSKLLTGQKINDATSGFRLANKKVISLYADYYPTDYPEPEVIIYLKNRGVTIKETPVKMNQRKNGISSITPLKSIYYMFKVIFAMFIQKIRG